MELFGNWTLDDARDWYRVGVRRAIYHRGRDARASGQQWGEADLARMKALSDIGLGTVDYRRDYARRPAAVSRYQRQSLYSRTRAGWGAKPNAGCL